MTDATAASATVPSRIHRGAWLFGPTVDLSCFVGSALLSFALLAFGVATGRTTDSTPDPIWLATVLAIDVAHVWGSLYRVYLDGDELRRRPVLFVGAPILLYLGGIALHAVGARVFWGVLAYLAVFHFVRQQYGWVAWYRTRASERDPIDRVIDTATIYAATVFPLLWWHGALPRRFFWLMPGDFIALDGLVSVSRAVASALHPVHWALLAVFVARQVQLLATGRAINAGKVAVVLSTWALWYVGIVVFDGDYAFTVTNVLAHGIPYFVLTWRYARGRSEEGSTTLGARLARVGLPVVIGSLVALAFLEEMAWDRLVWHDRSWLFPGPDVALGAVAATLVVPLLALPQATHYLLDAWVWRRGPANPTLRVLSPLAATTTGPLSPPGRGPG